MKLSDLTLQSLDLVQGVEKQLRQRRRGAGLGLGVASAGIVLQVGLAALSPEYAAHLEAVGKIALKLVTLDFDGLFAAGLPVPAFAGAILVVGGLLGFALLRWTGMLMRDSEECFRYSFKVVAFPAIEKTPPERCVVDNEDRLKLLAADLTERLNGRIGRLSILEAAQNTKDEQANSSLVAHIDIGGWYVVRQIDNRRWVVQVTSQVRIGGEQSPWKQTVPVKFALKPSCKTRATDKSEPENKDDAAAKTDSASKTDPHKEFEFEVADYNQLVERVYSRIATEVYRQIEADIDAKVRLFPTAYLRAVALSREAEDFARSNTIEAYDRAVVLYQQALRYFAVADIRPVTAWMSRTRLLWRAKTQFIHRKAMVVTGYAKCLAYRRRLSTLTGRYRNTLFEAPGLLSPVVADLEVLHQHIVGKAVKNPADYNRMFLSFPKDDWLTRILFRPGEVLFQRQVKTLFDTLVARALAYNELDAVTAAKDDLRRAYAVDPSRGERDPAYLLAAGEIEPDLEKAIRLTQKAAELAPDFQMAKFQLAYNYEMRFRSQDELAVSKAQRVIKAYEDVVLDLNPGNIAALSAEGYVLWLLEKHTDSRDKFQQGLDLKSIVEDTFVGELNYGLARIAAEQQCYFECYDRYIEVITTDPGIAAYSSLYAARSTGNQYAYIGASMMTRFERYKDAVLAKLEPLIQQGGPFYDPDKKECSKRTLAAVKSFVLNDFGNACLNYWIRQGRTRFLAKAIGSYREAFDADRSNAIAQYNLAYAFLYKGEPPGRVADCLKSAESLAPTWPIVRTQTAQAELRALRQKTDQITKDINKAKKELQDLESELSSTSEDRFLRSEGAFARFHAEESVEAETSRAAKIGQQKESSEEPDEGLPGRKRGTLGRLLRLRGDSEISSSVEGSEPDEGGARGARMFDSSRAARSTEEWVPAEPSLSIMIGNRAASLDELCEVRKAMGRETISGVMQRLRNALSETRFGPLIDMTEVDYDGKGVDGGLFSSIEKSRLDENDIEVLSLWSEVLWSNVESNRAWAAARELYAFHRNYYPEDFERDMSLLDANDRLESLAADAGETRHAIDEDIAKWLQAEKATCQQHAKDTVRRWTEEDPCNCDLLSWSDSLNSDEEEEERKRLFADPRRKTAGCMVALGNFCLSSGQWQDAIDAYTAAVKEADDEDSFHGLLADAHFQAGDFDAAARSYRDAIKLAPGNAAHHAGLGAALEALSHWAKACASYRQACEIEPEKSTHKSTLMLAFNNWGNSLYEAGKYAKAAVRYRKAIALDKTVALLHSNLALALERDDADPDALDKAIAALNAAKNLAAKNLAVEKDDYVARIRHLETLKSLDSFYGAKERRRLPAVTPISMEVSADLIPMVAGQGKLSDDAELAIQTLRNDVLDRFGIRVPGVRVHGDEGDLPNGAYEIMVKGVPLATGYAFSGRLVARQTQSKLEEHGVFADGAADPRTGGEVSWIDESDREKVEGLGNAIIKPITFVMDHLQVVVERNLSEFVGLQETHELLEERCQSMLEDVLATSGCLVDLACVLRAMLKEEVPLQPLESITRKFLDLSAAGASLGDMVAAMRLLPEIRPRLPGNHERSTLFALDDDFEAMLLQALRSTDRVPVLAMIPEDVQDALGAIRERAASETEAAIVVRAAELRPYLRALVELEFPMLAVLTTGELVPELQSAPRKNISLHSAEG